MSVLCSGHFNVLHADHIRMFKWACQYGPLIVGINGNQANVKKYGERSVKLNDRIFVLESNRWVSEVVVFEESEPSALIRKLRPKYYVKGPDYEGVRLPEEAALLETGTTLLIRPGIRKYSSTELVSSEA